MRQLSWMRTTRSSGRYFHVLRIELARFADCDSSLSAKRGIAIAHVRRMQPYSVLNYIGGVTIIAGSRL